MSVLKQGLLAVLWTIQTVFAKVITQQLHGRIRQRYGAHLSSFAHEPHLRGGFQPHIASTEVDELLHPGAGVVEKAQQDRVPAAVARSQIGLRQESRQIILAE